MKNQLNKVLLPMLLVFICVALFAQKTEYPFKDPGLSMAEGVNDLVSRLTLEEKAQQLLYGAPAIERLGIPAYNWWNECLHGVARNGRATIFPQAIGMAATFDTDLMQRVGDRWVSDALGALVRLGVAEALAGGAATAIRGDNI